jgi:hypothetical protein
MSLKVKKKTTDEKSQCLVRQHKDFTGKKGPATGAFNPFIFMQKTLAEKYCPDGNVSAAHI